MSSAASAAGAAGAAYAAAHPIIAGTAMATGGTVIGNQINNAIDWATGNSKFYPSNNMGNYGYTQHYGYPQQNPSNYPTYGNGATNGCYPGYNC